MFLVPAFYIPATLLIRPIGAQFSEVSLYFYCIFYDEYDFNLSEKKMFGISAGYSCRTNVFIEFHHLKKKEWTM